MSDVNELAVAGEPAEPIETPSANLMDPPTHDEEDAEWARYRAAEKAGLVDPDGHHPNEWAAFYGGRVIDYGRDMIALQGRVAARLGVHPARVVMAFQEWL